MHHHHHYYYPSSLNFIIINTIIIKTTIRWSDGMRCCRSAWALFVLLLSTLVCCQPTELIWCFFFCFITFPILLPPPPPGYRNDANQENTGKFRLPLQRVELCERVKVVVFTLRLVLHCGPAPSSLFLSFHFSFSFIIFVLTLENKTDFVGNRTNSNHRVQVSTI